MRQSDLPWDYSVTTGSKLSPDEAAAGLFPDATAVCVHHEDWGRTVTYYYIVERKNA